MTFSSSFKWNAMKRSSEMSMKKLYLINEAMKTSVKYILWLPIFCLWLQSHTFSDLERNEEMKKYIWPTTCKYRGLFFELFFILHFILFSLRLFRGLCREAEAREAGGWEEAHFREADPSGEPALLSAGWLLWPSEREADLEKMKLSQYSPLCLELFCLFSEAKKKLSNEKWPAMWLCNGEEKKWLADIG